MALNTTLKFLLKEAVCKYIKAMKTNVLKFHKYLNTLCLTFTPDEQDLEHTQFQ